MDEYGRVTARSGLRLRASPRTGRTIRVLPRGADVQILARETWLRVRVDGREGFVLDDWVEHDIDPRTVPPAAERDRASLCCPEFSHFVGKPLKVHPDFGEKLEDLNTVAAQHGIEVIVTSSFTLAGQTVEGAIVKPASRSNHLVGHAIDMNLRLGGAKFNSTLLRSANHPHLPMEIRGFLAAIPAIGMRWGGDFPQEDPVHIDDWVNPDANLWDEKFAAMQRNA